MTKTHICPFVDLAAGWNPSTERQVHRCFRLDTPFFPFHWHSEGMSRSIQNIIPVLYTHHHFILAYIRSKHFRIKSVYVYFVF